MFEEFQCLTRLINTTSKDDKRLNPHNLMQLNKMSFYGEQISLRLIHKLIDKETG